MSVVVARRAAVPRSVVAVDGELASKFPTTAGTMSSVHR